MKWHCSAVKCCWNHILTHTPVLHCVLDRILSLKIIFSEIFLKLWVSILLMPLSIFKRFCFIFLIPQTQIFRLKSESALSHVHFHTFIERLLRHLESIKKGRSTDQIVWSKENSDQNEDFPKSMAIVCPPSRNTHHIVPLNALHTCRYTALLALSLINKALPPLKLF